MKRLFIPLKTEFYLDFKSGLKDTEYRVYGVRWTEETCRIGRGVRLRKGYSGEEITGKIVGFKKATTADLPEKILLALFECYGRDVVKKFIACIRIELDHESRA